MAGDLPNIFASASGDVEAELLSPFVTLSPDTEEQLLDADGTSIVIFEKADDYLTDPGGSGRADRLRHARRREVNGRRNKHGVACTYVRRGFATPRPRTGELPPSLKHDRTAI